MNIISRLQSIFSSARICGCLLLLIGAISNSETQAAGRDIRHMAGAAAGIYSGIYVHELGHALAFRAAGAEEIRIRVPGTQCTLLCGQTDVKFADAPSPIARRTISAAGFMASNVAAELLLQNEAGARSAFGQGFVATNLYSNAAHVFTYYTKVRGRNGYRGNDIDAYELAGGNPHLLSAGSIAYSAFALRRMNRKNIPVMFVQLRF